MNTQNYTFISSTQPEYQQHQQPPITLIPNYDADVEDETDSNSDSEEESSDNGGGQCYSHHYYSIIIIIMLCVILYILLKVRKELTEVYDE